MTTMVDTIVSGLDTNWDAGIIVKPDILSKFQDRTANWYATIKEIAIDSVLVEQHQDRALEIIGIDGGGTYYDRERWEIHITIQTPGAEVAADGIEKEDRLKALYDAVKKALAAMSGSSYLYRVFRTNDRTPKGGTTNKWMMDIVVEVTTPASSATLSGSGHALDSHSNTLAMSEANGDTIYYDSGWKNLAKGSNDHVLTLDAGLPIWKAAPGAGGGETNTASSSGSGTSVYYQKTGVDLEFNAIKSENNRLAVALDGATHDIELTLTEGNIDHDALTNTHNLTTDIDHDTITNTHDLTTDVDHDAITNTHNLTTDVDHTTITNAHDLTTDIDHDTITNNHNLTTDIDHDTITNTHDLTSDIDHDTITNTHDMTSDIDHEAIANGHVFTATATIDLPVSMGVPYLDGGDNDVDISHPYIIANQPLVTITTNDTDHDGEWWWRVQLPDDFASFSSDAIKYYHYVSDTGNCTVTFAVTDLTDTFTDGAQNEGSITQTTITATELTNASVASSAGSIIVLKARVVGDAADIGYVGGVTMYYNKA